MFCNDECWGEHHTKVSTENGGEDIVRPLTVMVQFNSKRLSPCSTHGSKPIHLM